MTEASRDHEWREELDFNLMRGSLADWANTWAELRALIA
jgi:hypothetical protein